MNAARAKMEAEADRRGGKCCRVCGAPLQRCDAAHVIDRSLYPGQGFEEPEGIVPLCSRIKGGIGCHDAYDAHELDILVHLTHEEQAAAVAKVGILAAYRRTTGDRVNAEPVEPRLPDFPF